MKLQAERSNPIHPDAHVSRVTLTTADLAASITFYRQVLRLVVIDRSDNTALLGSAHHAFLELRERTGARQSPQSTGLYHFAVLVPTREDLGSALAHLRRISYPLQGAADHLVSEALYLADNEGNGIEIYRDRPRSEWLRIGSEIRMDTLPLDLRDLSAAAADDAREVPHNTTLGHVHLRVQDVERAVAFYRDGLGFDLTMMFGRDAAFFGAGGYHHHIGTNTWSTRGADPAPDGSAGLSSLTITLPTPVEVERTVGRMRDHGIPVLESAGTYTTHDPAGIRLELTTPQHSDRS